MTTKKPAASSLRLNLALAVIGSSNEPLLLLDGDLTIVAASASFCSAFAIDPERVAGLKLTDIGDGEWGLRQLGSLLKATASGMAEIGGYEMELKRDGQEPRHLVINARKLDYGDAVETRLLLAVSDITDARLAEKLKDDLLREKAILLQEVQHRVANSLQIIASVLLQKARKVQSEETRVHLTEAHQRVMSVAAVQQQLAASRLGSVALGPYFTQLCQSLGASMIHDPEQISLDVTADDSSVNADISVSMG